MGTQYRPPRPSEITPYSLFQQRRRWLRGLPVAALGLTLNPGAWAGPGSQPDDSCRALKLPDPGDQITPKRHATSYNNYYEFSTDKEAVRILAQALTLSPWTLTISGAVETPVTLDIDAINKLCVEERIYRFRCVEGWSMVVPWSGVMLSRIIKLAKPLSSARFVRFSSIVNPREMIGQRRPVLDWPYREALRLDEAMHPLTLLATGMYGQALPPQNGAPLRLVVPWKYGFKSIKALQHIELVAEKPTTTWQQAAPAEYGFYGNVNPDVAHPRWSQRREVPLGETHKKPTLMFNGYAEQVAGLYTHLDLNQHF
ncbi:MAG: protein-methionine-sulfoxide reductase catalytic subunit MsrP [Ketobacter sp.]|jgi:methionine sulfoxide reductase catalytic subunit|nr:protein-methionine-sulfoxide reductase catalytic subunit MsrP [Ketobacter sp.]